MIVSPIYSFLSAIRKDPNPTDSPAANNPQKKGCGKPPARTFGESHKKDSRIATAPQPMPAQCHGLRYTERLSATIPAETSDSDTINGASTGAAHGAGIRNRTSQVKKDAGHPMRSLRKT